MKSLRNALANWACADIPAIDSLVQTRLRSCSREILSGVKDYFSNRNDGILRGQSVRGISCSRPAQ